MGSSSISDLSQALGLFDAEMRSDALAQSEGKKLKEKFLGLLRKYQQEGKFLSVYTAAPDSKSKTENSLQLEDLDEDFFKKEEAMISQEMNRRRIQLNDVLSDADSKKAA